MDMTKTLPDGTVVRLRSPAPLLPPYVHYMLLRGLYARPRRRLDVLRQAWKGTSFFTDISMPIPFGKTPPV